jgi:hypothetical protein
MSNTKAQAINNCLNSIISINSFDRNPYEEKEALKEAWEHISTYPKLESMKRISLKTMGGPDKTAVKVERLLHDCLNGSLPASERESMLQEINSALFEALEYL